MSRRISRSTSLSCVSACLIAATVLPAAAADPSEPPVDFAAQVRPIFAAHCVKCHGAEKQEGGLRLDHRPSALRGGDSGAAIMPGHSGESELVRRITADESERMPPADGENQPLSAQQIAVIKRWIDQGAVWPDDGSRAKVTSDHWAFQPLGDPQPPAVTNAAWVRTPIDRFVLARLEAAGIAPSPEADRYTLIKRLHYDLHGLPPTPQDVDRFVNDPSPRAYESLVDRLLRSPHFGERWGRHWLDKARYADSDGYEKDRPRPDAWRYRNWVIDAINADMPFDRFTRRQLAGDLLPDATPMQKLATAFHRQTLTNTEGGADQEEFRVAAVMDRVNTTGTVWLGLTVGCAQCHTHKYDPITQAEYYQLFAFFNNGDETTTDIPISEQAVAKYERDTARHAEQVRLLAAKVQSSRQALTERLPAWEAEAQAKLRQESDQTIRFHPLEVVKVASQQGAKFQRLDDGSYLAAGKNPNSDIYTIIAKTNVPDITGVRLDALADPSLPAKGPGRVTHGNFVLSEIQLFAAKSRDVQPHDRVPLAGAQADFSQTDWPVHEALSFEPKTGWAISPQMGQDHWAVFTTARPIGGEGETWLKIVLSQQYGSRHTLGRFRVQVRTGRVPGDSLPEPVRQILALPPDQRDAKQQSALLDHFAALDPAHRQLQQQLTALKDKAPRPPTMSVRVISQRTTSPRTTHILRRGDFLQPTTAVEPDTLAVLHELEPRRPDAPPDRLDLANWLVSPDNPLTPRVAVNHIWGHLFGRGLVRTMGDFGTRGEEPTHPALLDWLAREFMKGGWSRKRLVKLIALSSAYRQASHHRPELADVDPNNNLLYRQNRFRVEGEIVRDLALAAAGLLCRKIGGPSVFPPLPADVAALSYANNFKWKTSPGEDRYRRGMYTFFKRTAPHPNLTTFDCPDANVTSVERPISNTPLMALIALNGAVYVEAAQAMGERLLTTPFPTDEERLTYAFRLCVARPPSAEELHEFQGLLDAARAWYHDHPDEAKQLVGPYQPEAVSPDEAAAWVATARIVLNMDEFLTRE